MAFVLSLSPTYEWPLAIEVPVDGGKFRRMTLTAIYHRLPQSQIDEIMLAQQELKAATESGAGGPEYRDLFRRVRGHAAEILAGWRDVKATDADTEDLPATAANMAAFLDVPGMANAIVSSYAESLAEGKRGN